MAAKTFTKRRISSKDIFIADDDAREILDIIGPGEASWEKDGQTFTNKQAMLVLSGPKGGEFRLSLPSWAYDQLREDIIEGDGFSGGWKEGKFQYTLWNEDEADDDEYEEDED